MVIDINQNPTLSLFEIRVDISVIKDSLSSFFLSFLSS